MVREGLRESYWREIRNLLHSSKGVPPSVRLPPHISSNAVIASLATRKGDRPAVVGKNRKEVAVRAWSIGEPIYELRGQAS